MTAKAVLKISKLSRPFPWCLDISLAMRAGAIGDQTRNSGKPLKGMSAWPTKLDRMMYMTRIAPAPMYAKTNLKAARATRRMSSMPNV